MASVPLVMLNRGDIITARVILHDQRIRHWKYGGECTPVVGSFAVGTSFNVVELNKVPGQMWVRVQIPGRNPPGYLKISGEEYAAAFTGSPSRQRVLLEGRKIINAHRYTYGQSRANGYTSDDIMDCSEFVYQSYRRAGFGSFPALNSHEMAKQFTTITHPEPGDIIYWSRGHVGLVDDPAKGTFLGAQSSGLAQANYKSGWWSTQAGKKFLRYVE